MPELLAQFLFLRRNVRQLVLQSFRGRPGLTPGLGFGFAQFLAFGSMHGLRGFPRGFPQLVAILGAFGLFLADAASCVAIAFALQFLRFRGLLVVVGWACHGSGPVWTCYGNRSPHWFFLASTGLSAKFFAENRNIGQGGRFPVHEVSPLMATARNEVMKPKIEVVPLAMIAALLATSCNTVRGTGKDLNSVANIVQDQMNK